MQKTLHTVGNAVYVHLVTPTFITGYNLSVITDEPGYYLWLKVRKKKNFLKCLFNSLKFALIFYFKNAL